MRNLNLLLSGVLALSLLAACTEKEENIYLIQKPRKTSAFGFVRLFDENPNPLTNASGVTVTVKDMTPAVQAVTDRNGRFQLDSLEEGNYVLRYEKAGYGEYEIGIRITSGGNQPFFITQYYYGDFGIPWQNVYIPLYQTSNVVPGPATVWVNPSPDTLNVVDSLVVFRGGISPALPANIYRNIVMLTDTTANISPVQYRESVIGVAYGNRYRIFINASQRRVSFKPGKTYYGRIYGAPSNSTTYIDRTTGRYVPTGLNPNPTSVFSFQVR